MQKLIRLAFLFATALFYLKFLKSCCIVKNRLLQWYCQFIKSYYKLLGKCKE